MLLPILFVLLRFRVLKYYNVQFFICCQWSKLLCVSQVKLTEIELINAPKGAFDAINNIALGLHKNY